MSTTSRLDTCALTITCSHCGAPPTAWCTTRPKRQRASQLHAARTAVVYDAWRVGYTEGLADQHATLVRKVGGLDLFGSLRRLVLDTMNDVLPGDFADDLDGDDTDG